jgi:hypothetical protein
MHYFESHGSQPCGKDENLAEWMLRVISAATSAVDEQDWIDTWRNSSEYADVHKELTRLENQRRSETTQEAGSDSAAESMAYAASLSDQLLLCTKRVFQQYWRTPSYMISMLS